MRRALLATLLAGCVSNLAFAGPIYSAVGGFSNPQMSPWSYGYAVGSPLGTFITLPSFRTPRLPQYPGLAGWYIPTGSDSLPAVILNTTDDVMSWLSVVQPNTMLNLHPMVWAGNPMYSIVRFTAPASSDYEVDAFFQGLDRYRTSTDVHVYVGSTSRLDGLVNGYGAGTRVPYSSRLFLGAGDTLDFVVGPGNNWYGCDSTGFEATITPVPEPASLLLFGTGLIGALRAVRRKRG